MPSAAYGSNANQSSALRRDAEQILNRTSLRPRFCERGHVVVRLIELFLVAVRRSEALAKAPERGSSAARRVTGLSTLVWVDRFVPHFQDTPALMSETPSSLGRRRARAVLARNGRGTCNPGADVGMGGVPISSTGAVDKKGYTKEQPNGGCEQGKRCVGRCRGLSPAIREPSG